MSILRIVRMSFKEENIEDFLSLFKNNSHKIANMRGCTHLELMKDPADYKVFYTYSIWEKESDLNDYRNSETFKTIWGECKKFFFEKPLAYSLDPFLLIKKK